MGDSKINEIIVLYNGYSYLSADKEKINNQSFECLKANCTCTLIKGKTKNIIIDTMTSWDSERIVQKLTENNVHPDDIDYVVSTHGHSDHLGCNYLFLKAVHIIANNISHKDSYYIHDFVENPFIIDEDIKIISSPGHTSTCVSAIVKNNNFGKDVVAAICGDLFECEGDIQDNQLFIDAGSHDVDLQKLSRWQISQIADIIIPGHGPMFQLSESQKQKLAEDAGKGVKGI